MLRKRGRTAPEEGRVELLGDLSSSCCFAADTSIKQKQRSSSFFSIPGLLVSFTGKSLAESDSMKSPTSPLDYKLFSNLASSLIRSPKSPGRSWDCSRVGLGLVDSLKDENKNILLGSQMRIIKTGNSKDRFNSFGEEQTETKNSTFSQLCSSKSKLEEIGKVNSCSSDPMHKTLKPDFDVSSLELIHSFMDSLADCEDYTCIISHGPNPKTTHIFGDCILESSMIESQNSKENEGGFECIVKGLSSLPLTYFLSFCCYCNKKLEENRDIYMYRGEKAFCSCNCRDQAILIDEESKPDKHASDSPSSAVFHQELFMEGLEVTS
ncbi:uncharacterized protein LOC110018306 isoform X2 [Phalaenopsis equestris]|nr:uncharacterized protein LOC110018306 isoform X2 [Phalaenopsis equestris]XP_020571237.1 uncharacterized protein LOC110018306 isoform X2 [Phalaenopsis equestris]XP_020571238.1 uncharacterized protein LOC110018306 isoform X2 [Phalaenopsis equestris]XP_020571240.1 uncharacterized protein LOC110018306 isoform X2 [Phalaenopsis equestris]